MLRLNQRKLFYLSIAGLAFLMLAACLGWSAALAAQKSENAAATEKRLQQAVEFLASDKLEGRGVGTQGLKLAAEYVAGEFQRIGLKTDLFDGKPFQRFSVTVQSELGPPEKNRLAFIGPAGKPGEESPQLELGEDFTPLSLGGSAVFEAPLAFAGYGITAKKEGYDDYAGIDAQGKAVIVLRHEPEQRNPHSVFNGTQDSQYARVSRKISNAYEHGAAAVILVTEDAEIRTKTADHQKRWQAAVAALAAANAEFLGVKEPTRQQVEEHSQRLEKLAEEIKSSGQQLREQFDPIFKFNHFDSGESPEGRQFPVLHCRRAAIDRIVTAALGADLATLERRIDEGPKPQSALLESWRATGETNISRIEAEIENVVGVLEGEGPVADETIVIGAHYDHLGYGGQGSLEPNVKAIHNGADDNASGTAALLEVAKLLAGRKQKLKRRIVFIAFTGEERGLLGSSRYVRQPLAPIEKTVAMLNMDMVGRLQNEKLIVYGTDTATEFEPLVDRLGKQYQFAITKQPGGFGPSDHAAFYAKQVPVLHFFTGTHPDYHRSSDDTEKINAGGMRRIAEMIADVAVELAQADVRPQYRESAARTFAGGGDRPYFGSVPDFSQTEPGYALSGVAKDGPAERAGIRGGDLLIQFGDSKIGNLEDFDSALRKYKAGDRVPVLIKRAGQEVKLEVTLDPPK